MYESSLKKRSRGRLKLIVALEVSVQSTGFQTAYSARVKSNRLSSLVNEQFAVLSSFS